MMIEKDLEEKIRRKKGGGRRMFFGWERNHQSFICEGRGHHFSALEPDRRVAFFFFEPRVGGSDGTMLLSLESSSSSGGRCVVGPISSESAESEEREARGVDVEGPCSSTSIESDAWCADGKGLGSSMSCSG